MAENSGLAPGGGQQGAAEPTQGAPAPAAEGQLADHAQLAVASAYPVSHDDAPGAVDLGPRLIDEAHAPGVAMGAVQMGFDATFGNGGVGDDHIAAGAVTDVAWDGHGAELYLFMEAMSNDAPYDGGGGSWIDVIELNATYDVGSTDGWSFEPTDGTVLPSGEHHGTTSHDATVTASHDVASAAPPDDGTALTFVGGDTFIW